MFNRILSLAPSNTEILFALGVGDRIVGCTKFCSYPTDTQRIPKIGSWVDDHDLPGIEKLEPDLILTSIFIPEPIRDWAQKHSVKLVNLDPKSLHGIYDSIAEIAALVGADSDAVISEMKTKLEKIRSKTKLFRKRPKLYNEEFGNPPTVGANWVPELIDTAGGSPMGRSGVKSDKVSPEQVDDFDPDMIVLHWCGSGTKADPRRVMQRKDWGKIRAVKTGNIFVVDDNLLNVPGPRVVEGAEWLFELIETFLEG